MLNKVLQYIGNGLGSARNAFVTGYQKATGWTTLERIFASALGDGDGRKKSPEVQLREYQSWIYTILTTIYGRTSTVPWNLKVEQPDGTTEILDRQFEHPMYKLLTKPNKFMTGTFLQQYIQMSLDLTGMAFVLKVRNRLKTPAELWPLNPAEFVDFIPGDSTDNFVKGYSFTHMDFAREDVIYLFYPNPDPTYFSSLGSQQRDMVFASIAGMSPVQAMARTVDTEKYIEIYERDFFENSARPDIILTPKDSANGKKVKFGPKERERLLTQWKQKHQGTSKFHEPTILSSMDITTLDATNKDFEFFNLAGWTQDLLFSAYSVPKAKVGLIEDVNRANQVGVEITFNEECVLPRLNLFDESFTNQLAHDFDERLLIKHDNPVPSDKEFDLKLQEADIKSFVRTVNDIRKERGLDEVSWGNAPWIPLNLAQPGGGGELEEPAKEPKVEPEDLDEGPEEEQELEEPEKTLPCGCGHHNIERQFLRDENARVAYWKQFDARARKHEKVFIRMVRRLFNNQRKEVLANLEKVAPQIEAQFAGWSKRKIARYIKQDQKLIKDILFDETKAVKTFEKASNPVIADAFEESGEAQLADLGVDLSFNLKDPRAEKFIGNKTKMFAKEVNDTTAKELTKTLREGFAEGEGVGKLASRVRKVYDKADRSRSIAIARTEVISSSNAGALEGMKQSKVVKKKEWLSSRDDRVRESHLAPLDGQQTNIGGTFTSNDGNTAQHPGGFGVAEEDVNCRCSVIPVIE